MIRTPQMARMWPAATLFCGTLALIGSPSVAAAQADPAHAHAAAATPPDSGHARVRLRVVGVFDAETGLPIESADVSDHLSGLTSRTTKTGTVAVFLSDTNGTLLRIKKVGYQASTVLLSTTLADTTPVTVTMLRSGYALAPVITVGQKSVRLSPSDTVSTLLRNGFYERRETGAAPRSAFITGDKLQASSVVTNARFYGRPICEANLYIDGMHFVAPKRTGHFQKEGIDAFVNPFDIAGIETYTSAEAPASTTGTAEGTGAMDIAATTAASAVANAAGTMSDIGCVTLIWMKK
jgi:hypothetical protein